MSYRNTLLGWFAAIALVLAVVGSIVYNAVRGFVRDAAQVTAAHEVLQTLSNTMGLLADAESGQRGYVITGRAQYLEPYHTAQAELEDALARLARLTADQPAQRDRAAQLATEIRARLERMHRTVTARAQGFQAAEQLVLTGEGRRMTDSIRKLVDRMTDEEHMLLAERDAAARRSASLTLAAGTGGLALAAAIMLLLLQAIRREHLRREETEQRLQANNVDLAQSLDRVRDLGREMTILGSMADLLQSCRSLDEARPVIQRALGQLLPQNGGAVCLLNASQNHMETVIEWTPSDGGSAGTLAVFAPDQCWALRRGRVHAVDEASGQQCLHLAKPAPTHYACLPMMAQGETLGVMFVQGEGSTAEDRLRVVRTASEQVALALANLRLQESLRTQSIRDPLTGLFNRRYLEASLERELARAKRARHPLCVVMLDVDHFKRFNDTHGHEAGDAVLVEVANVLKGVTREDDIACRYGGEEFTLILPEATIEVARERAEQVRLQVRKLLLEHRRKSLGTVTASFGIALFPDDSATPSGLVQAADAALYRAKHDGRDRVVLASEVAPAG